jgi:hypothetical protein
MHPTIFANGHFFLVMGSLALACASVNKYNRFVAKFHKFRAKYLIDQSFISSELSILLITQGLHKD